MHSLLRRPAVALLATALAGSVLGIVPVAHAADGTLSGRVTVPGGAGLEGVRVEVYEFVDGDWDVLVSKDSGPLGAYSFTLPEGDYRVGVEDTDDVYAAEFYNNADIVEDGTTVTVPSSLGSAVDIELAPAAHITGTVRDENGDPLQFVTVEAYRTVVVDGRTEYRGVGNNQTAGPFDPDASLGTYDIGGLPGGDYLIQFEAYAQQGAHVYAIEWWNNKPNRYVATPVTVADGGTPSAPIDAQLELDSEISGVVYDTVAGTPVDNGSVSVYVKDGDQYLEVEDVDVESDGTYVIDGLSADTYYVRFRANVAGGFAQEYWDDEVGPLTATPVPLVEGEVRDLDPVLVFGENVQPSLQPVTPPTISGTPQVGSPLTASPGTWNPSPTIIRYVWYIGEDERQDGSSNTYVPVVADIGKQVSVDAYVSRPGYDNSRNTSAPTAPVVAAPVVTPPVVTPPVVTPPVVTPPVVTPPAPVVDLPAALAKALAAIKVSGKAKVGKTLKVRNLDLDVGAAVTYKFQWYAGTKKIKKATKSKLKVLKSMKGKKLSVKVTGKVGSTSKSVKIKVGKVK